MAKIYINVKGETFKGKDGKTHNKLWTIERKISGNMQLSGATINGKPCYIDPTVPTTVDKLPKGAKEVPDSKAEELYKKDSYCFGE